MEFNINKSVDKVIDKLHSWMETFITMLPNMAVSLLLIVLFIALAKIIQGIFKKIFKKASDNIALENLFGTIIYYSTLAIGLFLILGVLKLDKAVTSLLAGIGVAGLALGFAFQDIAANFVSGIILAFHKPFQVGHIVEIKDVMGKISRTNLRVTVIESFQGQEVYVPNKDVLQTEIKNYSVLGKRRIDLPVGISYGDDLDKVENVVVHAIRDLDGVIDQDNIIFDYTGFGDSSINFNIRFWIRYPDQPGFLSMRNKAVKSIKSAFDTHNITIPFPIRTLDFGIKGGEKLSEMPLTLSNNR